MVRPMVGQLTHRAGLALKRASGHRQRKIEIGTCTGAPVVSRQRTVVLLARSVTTGDRHTEKISPGQFAKEVPDGDRG